MRNARWGKRDRSHLVYLGVERLDNVAIKSVGQWLARLAPFEEQQTGLRQFRQPFVRARRSQPGGQLIRRGHGYRQTPHDRRIDAWERGRGGDDLAAPPSVRQRL